MYVIIYSVTMERNVHNVIPKNKLKHYMLAKHSFLFQHKQGFKNIQKVNRSFQTSICTPLAQFSPIFGKILLSL